MTSFSSFEMGAFAATCSALAARALDYLRLFATERPSFGLLLLEDGSRSPAPVESGRKSMRHPSTPGEGQRRRSPRATDGSAIEDAEAVWGTLRRVETMFCSFESRGRGAAAGTFVPYKRVPHPPQSLQRVYVADVASEFMLASQIVRHPHG